MADNVLFESYLHHVVTTPNRVALVGFIKQGSGDKAISLSWRQLAEAVDLTALGLRSVQFESDATTHAFGYSSDNQIFDVILALAIMSIGGIEIPFDHRLPETLRHRLWQQFHGVWIGDDVKQLIQRSLRTSQQQLEPYESGHHDPADYQLILWTTGTTDVPKGVVLSQQSLGLNALAKFSAVPQVSDSVRFTSLPLAHAYARTCDFGTWLISGCQLVVSLGFKGWSDHAVTFKPTHANMTPGLARRLAMKLRNEHESPEICEAISNLQVLGCGGAAMSESDFRFWAERGVRVVQGYGLTEAGPVICSATPENGIASLVGKPVDGWETKLVDGELYVRGSHVMTEYWDDSKSTAEKIDSEGWMSTGDLVEIDEASGQYRILGRKDDAIVLDNGFKIHPRSIESIAELTSGVLHAIAVSADGKIELWVDTITGTLSNGELAELNRRLKQDLPKWSWPASVHCFTPPLSADDGELTIKDTPRRGRIIDNRWGTAGRE